MPKDKEKKQDSVRSEKFSSMVINEGKEQNAGENIDAALRNTGEESANAIAAQRGVRKPIPTAMELHNRMKEHAQNARDKDAAHRREMEKNPTKYSLMPATDSPEKAAEKKNKFDPDKAMRSQVSEAVTGRKKSEKKNEFDPDKAMRSQVSEAVKGNKTHPPVDNTSLKGKEPAKPAIQRYLGHAASAASKMGNIKKNERVSSNKRTHATTEERLEAKAKKIFHKSKSTDKSPSAHDVFKQADTTDNIRRPGKK